MSTFCVCPCCGESIAASLINDHLDSGCLAGWPTASHGGGGNGKRPRPPMSQPAATTATAAAPQHPPPQRQRVSMTAAVPRAARITEPSAPLAERMRPRTVDEMCGQSDALNTLGPLLAQDSLPSLILWGPPGCGKTSFAAVVEHATIHVFKRISAVTCGVKEIREVVAAAAGALRLSRRRTILFVDEIHRFNKGQQDAFLPHVEQGTIILLGATTENPSFSLNAALLSRCRVVVLAQLTPENLAPLLTRALADNERGLGEVDVELAPGVLDALSRLADGDARAALNALELAVAAAEAGDSEGDGSADDKGQQQKHGRRVTVALVERALQKTHLLYDRAGDEHYNVISALHKSMRGSDPDAALYWSGRMLAGGEDPRYIARRLIRFASEDIGIAGKRNEH